MSGQSTAFDAAEFRKALGSFATGVTIITTRTADGTPVGLTANSFNSVSLNPPLVLWSLANTSMSLAAFRAATHWAVHILATDQEELSARFAKRSENKFAGLEVKNGQGGAPLLPGCSARFQCRTAFQYEGGDHVIFLGEVLDFDRCEAAPLVFHGGRYAHATRRDPLGARPRSAYLAGSFGDDFLGYLLGRSHFRMFAQIRQHLEQAHLTDQEFYVMSALTLKRAMSVQDLDSGMAGVLDQNSRRAVESLVQHGFARETVPDEGAEGPAFELTEAGSECALRVITAAKAVEADVLDRLGAGEAPVLKSLLNRLLAVIDPESGVLWEEKGPTA